MEWIRCGCGQYGCGLFVSEVLALEKCSFPHNTLDCGPTGSLSWSLLRLCFTIWKGSMVAIQEVDWDP